MSNIFLEPISLGMVLQIVFVFLAFIILRKFVVKFIIKSIRKLAAVWDKPNISLALESTEKSLNNIVYISSVFLVLWILPLKTTIDAVIFIIYKIGVVLIVGNGLLKLIDSYKHIIMDNEDLFEKRPILKTVLPLTIKIIKFLIILIIVVIIAVELGFEELKSLLAGVGIGGIAVAMAAQDLLKNVFGGFIILTDRSFKTGDFIKIDSNEGVVEEVGIRSTKVRTLEQELIIVPNSKFVDGSVINYSMRGTRRVKQILGATYATSSEQLKRVISEIENYLRKSDVVLSDTINVKFEGFGSSSLDLIVLYRINTSDYDEYLSIKQKVNFEIMSIFERNNVGFAYPSVSVYMEK